MARPCRRLRASRRMPSFRALELELLPVRLLKEYAYCPRYAYFQVFVNREYVTESMESALELLDPLERLDPMGWEVRRSVYVASRRLGLYGVADALLVKCRLVKSVEAKPLSDVSRRSLFRRHRHVLAQAVAYGMCAEETLGLTLASVVVVGASRQVEVRVTPALRRYVESLAEGLRRMVALEEDPGPYRRRGCGYCRFRDLCASAPNPRLRWG